MFIATYGKLLKTRFYRKKGKLCVFFGKVLHSSFASRDYVCINTEDPTLVIIMPPQSLLDKYFGEIKFGDQASICQICQNLLPPIFSAIRYNYIIGEKVNEHKYKIF